MVKLIGVGGYAGAGKDEIAAHLVSKYGFKRDAFADRMRTALLALDPIITFEAQVSVVRLSELVAELGWDRAKRDYPEVRRLLQKFGTEAGRDIHGEGCWVNALFSDYTVDEILDYDNPFRLVIPDVRFPNEIKAIRSRGGITAWVDRPGVGPVNDHASDNSLGDGNFDYVLYNNGTIEDLHRKIDLWMEGAWR